MTNRLKYKALMIDRHRAASNIYQLGLKYCDALDVDPSRGCVFFAGVGTVYLRALGLDSHMQGGSVYWLANENDVRDNDDEPNSYGHVFDESLTAEQAEQLDRMPDLHAWVGLKHDPDELVDVTTRYFKRRATELGIAWTRPDPPPYLFVTYGTVNDHHRYNYQPHGMAMRLVLACNVGEPAVGVLRQVVQWGLQSLVDPRMTTKQRRKRSVRKRRMRRR